MKSMTGFATVHAVLANCKVTLTIRSLNHRHTEIKVSSPYPNLEYEMHSYLKKIILRGKIDVILHVEFIEAQFEKQKLLHLKIYLVILRSKMIK